MFIKFLVNIYYYFISLIRNKNYDILRTSLLYSRCPIEGVEAPDNRYWYQEYLYWGKEPDEYFTPINHQGQLNEMVSNIPTDVSNVVVKIVYEWGGKQYKMMTRNMNWEWPPARPKMGFKIPITRVVLLDAKDHVLCDVTHKLKRYLGPFSTFHEDCLVRDIFDAAEWTTVQVTNLIGATWDVDAEASIHQLLSPPSKNANAQG